MIVEIVANIYCDNLSAENTAYRLYIDGDLYTERTFIWSHRKNYVSECSYADLGSGTHEVRVESCKFPNKFSIKGISVNGIAASQSFTI
jgi:hypothetical protein